METGVPQARATRHLCRSVALLWTSSGFWRAPRARARAVVSPAASSQRHGRDLFGEPGTLDVLAPLDKERRQQLGDSVAELDREACDGGR